MNERRCGHSPALRCGNCPETLALQRYIGAQSRREARKARRAYRHTLEAPLRLTERGEFVCGVLLLSALVVVAVALLWMVAG